MPFTSITPNAGDRGTLPQGSPPVPGKLDWDLWLGPLPWREYHPDWMAYSHWRETSNGGLRVFGPHTAIFPFLTLQMRTLWNGAGGGPPIRVTAEAAKINRVSFPRWERVRWKIPVRNELPPVTVTGHHGPNFAPGAVRLFTRKCARSASRKNQGSHLTI
jgi:hypothetical protein